jgi:hypothetical protein
MSLVCFVTQVLSTLNSRPPPGERGVAVRVEEGHPEVIAIDEFRPATIEPAIV